MKLEVLISCMFKNGKDIIERTNIQTDVLVINQCNTENVEEFSFVNQKGYKCLARVFNTKERGLSRSRNMAIQKARGDILLICDDDECFESNYEDTILNAFSEYPECNILAFNLKHPNITFSTKTHKIGYFNAPKIASWQLAIKNTSNLKKIRFCEKMGSGTGNGAGEENKFIIDCLSNSFKIRYVPYYIGNVEQNESLWFHGYTQKYWQDRGWVSKMIYGNFWGYIYIWYTIMFRAWKIDKKHSLFNILKWLHQGFKETR